MNPLKELFESGQTILWIETQNTVAFLRPVRDILVWTPCPTACLADEASRSLLAATLATGTIRSAPSKSGCKHLSSTKSIARFDFTC
jgi:hypothetical protein